MSQRTPKPLVLSRNRRAAEPPTETDRSGHLGFPGVNVFPGGPGSLGSAFGGSIAVLCMSRRTFMRISLVALFCAGGLTASGGALADDKGDFEKEVSKFRGAWTFESSEAGGKELPAGELK